jgi:hypothetical protein
LTAIGAKQYDRDSRRVLVGHLALIICVSAAFESLFIHHGIGWLFDEGWPLYAAMSLHDGGVLYDDVFFLFPPGHLLPAWIAYAIDPPGVVLTRAFYAAFNVALCGTIYLLGRKLMKPSFALLAALLLAVAAPRSHLVHVVFGYRYLVFAVLSLLAFSMRLRTGERRWMGIAGLCTGIALYFRLTPAFSVSCGIAVAVLCAERDWRAWLRDYLAYAAGILLIAIPVLAWFANGAGLEALWSHAVLRILPLQTLSSIPVPEMILPDEWDRKLIYEWFAAFGFRFYPVMYLGYAAWLVVEWGRSIRDKRPFEHPLLVAVVLWGSIYLLRALGRSDEHHLMTAIPPVCLFLAHGLGVAHRALTGSEMAPSQSSNEASPRKVIRAVGAAFGVASIVGLWAFLQGSDLYLDRANRGIHPLRSLDNRVFVGQAKTAVRLDHSVSLIASFTGPDDRVLDLTNSPMIHVLANRRGPGYGDVVSPGIFEDPDDLHEFIQRLEQDPPELVLWPRRPFDGMKSRSLRVHAKPLATWVFANYRRISGDHTREIIMKRRSSGRRRPSARAQPPGKRTPSR